MSTNVHKLKNSSRLGPIVAILAIGLLLAASSARATVFDLTSDHCTGGCGTPPFGTVTVTQNGTSVDITVDLATGYKFAKTGSADFQAFKFNGTGVALGDITVDQTVSGQTLAAMTGAFNGDGTGMFTFGIECTTCKNGGASAFDDNIVFHVADATIADLTQGNNFNIIFVADVLAPNGNTGPVDVTGPGGRTPDSGSTALLLGLSLFGLGFVRMPFRKKA